MSNMLRKGKRLAARENKKVVKKSTKEFYRILAEIDEVADLMKADEKVMDGLNEDNIVERAAPYTELEMAGLEKMVLMGKLGMYDQMQKEIENAGQDTK